MRIAIVGPPNAGKSSLLNLLAGHDAAIVSPVAGTTRDLVQVQLELGGNKVCSLLVSVHQLNQWVEVKTHPSLRLGWLAGTLAGCRGLACTRDLHTLPAAREVTGLDGAWGHWPGMPASLQVILIDSAGLRQTDCPIEAEGVRRTVAAAQQAHVVVHVADAAAGFGASAGQAQADEQPADSAALPLAPHALQLWVLNKADLLEPEAAAGQKLWPAAARVAAQQAACEAATGNGQQPAAAAGSSDQQPAAAAAEVDRQPIVISCRTGQGIEQLLGALQQHVAALVAQGGDDGMERALPTRARHRWAQSTVGRTGSDWQGRAWWLASGLEASFTNLHIAPRARCPLHIPGPPAGTTCLKLWRHCSATRRQQAANWRWRVRSCALPQERWAG